MSFIREKEAFERRSFILVVYTVIVILWGAWVRISHSGDGCGKSWPLCGEGLVPNHAVSGATWIEFSHRLSSGIFGVLVFALFIWGLRKFPVGSQMRKWLYSLLFFTFSEAALGAQLVLKGLVGLDASIARTVVMSLHMFNSLLLVGSAAMIWRLASSYNPMARLYLLRRKAGYLLLLFFMTVCVLGAIASLSVTLYPNMGSLLEGLQADFSDKSHFLLRLRLFHPLLAISFIGAVLLISYGQREKLFSVRFLRGKRLLSLFVLGGILGGFTLFMHSVVWIKIMHLLLAHVMWVALLFAVTRIGDSD